MPSGAERMPARRRVVSRISRSRVIDDAVQLIGARRRRRRRRRAVGAQVEITQRKVNTAVQFAEPLARTESFQICVDNLKKKKKKKKN